MTSDRSQVVKQLERITDGLGEEKAVIEYFGSSFYDYLRAIGGGKIGFESLVSFVETIVNKLEIENKAILDLGCGYGLHSIILSCYGNSVVGIDQHDHSINVFGKILKKLDYNPSIPPIRGDAVNLPFKKNSFDIVYCNQFVSHVSDLAKCFLEVQRVLKEDGLAVISDTERNGLRSLWQQRIQLPRLYKKLFEKKRLEIISSYCSEIGLKLPEPLINKIAKKTEGWVKEEITGILREYKESNAEIKVLLCRRQPVFPFRDPETGMWEERLFTPNEIVNSLAKTKLYARNLPLCEPANSSYVKSLLSILLNIPLNLFNPPNLLTLLRSLAKLLLSPIVGGFTYTVVGFKRKRTLRQPAENISKATANPTL